MVSLILCTSAALSKHCCKNKFIKICLFILLEKHKVKWKYLIWTSYVTSRSATSFSCRFKEGKKFGSFPCLKIHANMHQCRSKTCQVIYVVHWFYNKISNIARLPRIAQENVLKTNWTVGLLPPLLFSTNPHCNSSVSAKIS